MTSFDDLVAMARQSRSAYRELERRKWGKEWDAQDIFTGMVGDVGDLAQLMGAHAGLRPGPEDLKSGLGHELADILWSLLVLAEELGVDLERSFLDLHELLLDRVSSKLAAMDDQSWPA